MANARQNGGACREGERTTSSPPPSTANRYRMDTQDTYDSSSQRICYNSDPGELNLISVRSVVSESVSVAGKTAAAASLHKDDRLAVTFRSRGGGSPSQSLMDGRVNDDDDDEAAVPLPLHVTVNDDNSATAAHGGMVQTMDVMSFAMNNRALIMTVLKVI